MTGPDEPQHIVNAVAVAHGQVGRATVGSPIGRRFLVDVPDYVVQERRNACTAFHPNITAACQRPRPARAGMSSALTQFNNYPALYYAVVGSATYATSGLPAFVAMRVLSVLLCAAMLTAATSFLLWSGWRRRALLGLTAGITPMTLFLTGVVNDSAFEITAGVAAWAGAIHLCTVTKPTRRARVLFAVVCLCFANARAPDVAYLPAIVIIVAVVTGARATPWWRPLGAGAVWVPVLAADLLGLVYLVVYGPQTSSAAVPSTRSGSGLQPTSACTGCHFMAMKSSASSVGWTPRCPPRSAPCGSWPSAALRSTRRGGAPCGRSSSAGCCQSSAS